MPKIPFLKEPIVEPSLPKPFRLCVLGPAECGKTALIARLTQRYIDPHFHPSCEEYFRRQFMMDNIPVVLQVEEVGRYVDVQTDVCEQDEPPEGFVIVYDITDEYSLCNAERFHSLIRILTDKTELPCVMVGNKLDLEEHRKVPIENVIETSKRMKCPFFECSAYTKHNVNRVFNEIAKIVYDLRAQEPEKYTVAANRSARMIKCNIL